MFIQIKFSLCVQWQLKVIENVKKKSSFFPEIEITGATTRQRGHEEPSLGIHCSGRVYPLSILPALYLHFGKFAKYCFQ